MNQTKEKISWIIAQIGLDQISLHRLLHYQTITVTTRYSILYYYTLIKKHYPWLNCVWTEGFNFIHPCHPFIVLKSETVIDSHWPTYLLSERIVYQTEQNYYVAREILIQVTDWIDLDSSVKVLSDKWHNLWHWSQIILNSGNWERSSSKTILYNLNWAIPSSATRVLSSYPFPSQLFSVVSSLSFCWSYCFNG